MPDPVRIVIADDHAILRDGLRRLLESEHMAVVGEAANGAEAVARVRELRPDVLLLDLDMPRLSGLEALEQMDVAALGTKVLLLTAHATRADTLKALRLGARGVVAKETAARTLLKAVHTVLAGQYWVGREVVGSLVEMSQRLAGPAAASSPGLTAREREVVVAVAGGAGNRDIARQLGISEHTVKHHLTSVFDKLGVGSRLELAIMARDLGLD